MNRHDVIRQIGRFPDRILSEEEFKVDTSFMSKRWKCSCCEVIHEFDEPVDIPAPCTSCGGIFFEKL